MNYRSGHKLLIFSLFYSFSLYTAPTDYPYPVIKPIVEQYKRSITILDINATKNSPAIKFAESPHIAILLSENDLLTPLTENDFKLDNITILQSVPTLKTITRLAECEHFDLTLALNPIEFTHDNCELRLDILLALGENLIVQIPQSLLEFTKKNEGKLLAQSYHPQLLETIYLVHFKQKKQRLFRSTWYNPPCPGKYYINSSNEQKVLYLKEKNRYTFWHSGINFETFKALNGIWPKEDMIADQLGQLEEATDIILHGTTLIEN